MKSHKDLDVWQVSIQLAKEVYEVTRAYPREEQYGLVSQMRRSAVSIASNIAEGGARQGTKEFVHFLFVAVGSANELDAQIEISKAVKLGDGAALERLQGDVTRVTVMLRGLIRSLRTE